MPAALSVTRRRLHWHRCHWTCTATISVHGQPPHRCCPPGHNAAPSPEKHSTSTAANVVTQQELLLLAQPRCDRLASLSLISFFSIAFSVSHLSQIRIRKSATEIHLFLPHLNLHRSAATVCLQHRHHHVLAQFLSLIHVHRGVICTAAVTIAHLLRGTAAVPFSFGRS